MALFSEFAGPDGLAPDCAAGLPVVRVNLENIRHNWKYLASLSKGRPAMAVIKADAYGHGLEPVARVVMSEGCRTLAVGSVSEGVLLRKKLSGAANGVTIFPLLGVLSAQDAANAVDNVLFPMVASAEQAGFVSAACASRCAKEPLPVAVKVETGMSRLGFRATEMQEFISALRSFTNIRPTLLLSHLAAADDPNQDASVTAQVERFLTAYAAMREFWPDIAISLANSAGHIGQDIHLAALPPHIGRPGLSLYGEDPFSGTTRAGMAKELRPAMQVAAPIMGVHNLVKGYPVSYGCTYRAERDMRIAVIGAGYADGLSRNLSNKGHVVIRGKRCPVVGRVCMQMQMADISQVPDAACGDAAFILGGDWGGDNRERISMGDICRDWGTIPQEVFCALGKNPRVYQA